MGFRVKKYLNTNPLVALLGGYCDQVSALHGCFLDEAITIRRPPGDTPASRHLQRRRSRFSGILEASLGIDQCFSKKTLKP